MHTYVDIYYEPTEQDLQDWAEHLASLEAGEGGAMSPADSVPAAAVDRWKPVARPGGVYCSPACGHGCLRAEHDKAHEDAKALSALLGEGWTYRVWENLGWHYAVKSPCTRMEIHHSRYGNRSIYTAFLGDYGSIGGHWTASREDPKEAIRAVVNEGREALGRMGAVFTDLSDFESEKER